VGGGDGFPGRRGALCSNPTSLRPPGSRGGAPGHRRRLRCGTTAHSGRPIADRRGGLHSPSRLHRTPRGPGERSPRRQCPKRTPIVFRGSATEAPPAGPAACWTGAAVGTTGLSKWRRAGQNGVRALGAFRGGAWSVKTIHPFVLRPPTGQLDHASAGEGNYWNFSPASLHGERLTSEGPAFGKTVVVPNFAGRCQIERIRKVTHGSIQPRRGNTGPLV
jgi:hypothetical protein